MFKSALYLSKRYVPKGGFGNMNCSLFNRHIKFNFHPFELGNSFFSPKMCFFCEKKSKQEEPFKKYFDARVENNEGEVLFQQGKYKEAAEKFRSSIKKNPDNPNPYVNLGCVLDVFLKEYDEAIDVFEQAIELFPDNYRLQFGLGSLYLGQEKYGEAIIRLKKAIELNPNVGLPHIALAKALYKLGRKEEVFSTFQNAIEVNPKSSIIYQDWSFVLLTEGRYKEAAGKFFKSLTYKTLEKLGLTKKPPQI